MGTKTAAAKIKARSKDYIPEADYTDDPYAHLAAAIILRAYDDLQEMRGQKRAMVCYNIVSMEELI